MRAHTRVEIQLQSRNRIYTINTLSHIKKATHTAKYKAEAVVQ